MPAPINPKILLVEPDDAIANQISDALTPLGIPAPTRCRSYAEALDAAQSIHPDLAFVDLAISDSEPGIGVARALREQCDVPVVFLTSRPDTGMLRAAMQADSFGYVKPPFQKRDWATIIDLATYRHRSERHVRESRAQHAAILHAAIDGFLIADAQGRLLDVNNAYCELTGFSREELLALSLPELTHPAEAVDVARFVEDLQRRGSARFERQQRCKNGHFVEVEVSANYLPNSGGRIFAFVRNMTDQRTAELGRQAAERAHRESEFKFVKAFQSSPVMMALSSHDDGTFVEVNERFIAVSGFTREEAVGKRSTDLGWVDLATRQRLLGQLEHNGGLREIEIPAHTKDGRTLRVLYSGETLYADGRRLILSAWRDVTEERRAEARLTLQSSALEAAANAIVITNREGVIEWANPAFTRFSGYRPEEFTGKTFRELINSGHHDDTFFAHLWRTIGSGAVWHGEITNRRKDDTVYVDETTITPVKAPDGTITHFIAVKQDITERRTLEEQFRQAQKMEAIGQLAGGVAHDFNNILAAVLMYLGILQDETAVDPQLRGMIKELQKEVKRGAGLTRQLLTFSRQQSIEPQLLDLNQVVDGLMKMLSRLLGEHIAISVHHSPDKLPAIEADLGMIEQVVINLCVNARDAMEKGGQLRLHTANVEFPHDHVPGHPEARRGRFVRLTVSDTGCGMDELTLQRIFEPFFTTKPAGKGTGLGLATVYGIVKQHHGWVEVQSALRAGTNFSVYLPAVEAPADLTVPTDAPRPVRGKGEYVLVVEDDVHVRSLVTRALQLAGYNVLEADSGPSALELWRHHAREVALLLTDLVMPNGMDGRALAATLRRDKPGLRVVLCTGYSQIVGPADDGDDLILLRKPFDAPELLRVIRSALDAT